MEHVKLLEVESQHLSFCFYMQQVQLEGDQTVKCKAKVKVTEPFTKNAKLQPGSMNTRFAIIVNLEI